MDGTRRAGRRCSRDPGSVGEWVELGGPISPPAADWAPGSCLVGARGCRGAGGPFVLTAGPALGLATVREPRALFWAARSARPAPPCQAWSQAGPTPNVQKSQPEPPPPPAQPRTNVSDRQTDEPTDQRPTSSTGRPALRGKGVLGVRASSGEWQGHRIRASLNNF